MQTLYNIRKLTWLAKKTVVKMTKVVADAVRVQPGQSRQNI